MICGIGSVVSENITKVAIINPSYEIYKKMARRVRLVRYFCLFAILLLLGVGASQFITIGFNTTNSLPGHVFVIVKNLPPKPGEMHAFKAPKNDFYNKTDFIKYVIGKPGDYIDKKGQSFFLNGKYIGDAKIRSNTGVKLQASESGIIPNDYYFVWTEHKDSFDSRYAQIGWIYKDMFIGRAYRIF